ncbi:unnamed protein product [Linum tenue]|uniref:RING-type domain-containing protein n=1 Tax=Linum tenue TaxID=586396 RepID=A0AAV0R5F5_9ROSI|nr:unnamed protein product [Linum tenue]
MKQGEEVSKLRCSHLFHRPCLDRWFQSRGGGGPLTCPLCRDNSLFRPREALAAAADGVEVLELRLVGGGSGDSDDRDSWWLR